MRTFIKLGIAVILVATLILLPISGVGAAKNQGFTGWWEATDTFDGSYEKLTIRGSEGKFHVMLYDYGCSVCGLDPQDEPMYACIATGKGTAEGNVLAVEFFLKCLGCPDCRGFHIPFEFIYDPDADTLTDTLAGDGLTTTWHRANPGFRH